MHFIALDKKVQYQTISRNIRQNKSKLYLLNFVFSFSDQISHISKKMSCLFPDNWSNSFKFFLCLTYYLHNFFLGNFIDLISRVFDQTWISSLKSVQASVYWMLSSVCKIVSVSETFSLLSFSYHFFRHVC